MGIHFFVTFVPYPTGVCGLYFLPNSEDSRVASLPGVTSKYNLVPDIVPEGWHAQAMLGREMVFAIRPK